MKIDVKVLCPSCEKCKLFEMVEDKIYANNEIYENIYSCEHLKICQNAIEIHADDSEAEK